MSIHTKKVEILPYDPQWRQQFHARKTDLARILQGLPILAIEHVGSTSVEGLAAKAILDIDVVLPSREVFPDVRRRLEQVGYRHEGDLGIAGREAFDRPEPLETMAYHLYVCAQDNLAYREHIAFRDYLRTHEPARMAYQSLKILLAQQFPRDAEAYCQSKTDFIRGILAGLSF